MFDEITKRKKPIAERLILYGFKIKENYYEYRTYIHNGEFELTIQIRSDGGIETELIENETHEKYFLYKTNAVGSYVGEIRSTIEQKLSDVVDKCFETTIFKYVQTNTIIEFVRNCYGDEPEFLWKKSPDNAIWRRNDNKKWYGAILTVAGNKVGLETEKPVEIIDLRMNPADAEAILSRENYYPGWHMNKKSWYTLVLDGSVSDDEIKERIKESYALAKK